VEDATPESADPPTPRPLGAGPNPPLFSVVVHAFQRKEFLASAVASLADQSLPRGEFEILVIKSFADVELADRLDQIGVRTLDGAGQTYGGAISAAVRASRGKFVAFLDDDDEFVETKLARVRGIIDRFPRFDYYRNDYVEIGREGRALPPSGERQAIDRRTGGRGVEFFSGDSLREGYDRLMDWIPEARLSCVVLRRAFADSIAPRLVPVTMGVDFVLFFAGLASPGGVVIDPERLTRYRRHPTNTTSALGGDPDLFQLLGQGSRTMASASSDILLGLGASWQRARLDEELAGHSLYVATRSPTASRRALAEGLLAIAHHPRCLRHPGRIDLFAHAALRLLTEVPRGERAR
jgi:hypothetical protein